MRAQIRSVHVIGILPFHCELQAALSLVGRYTSDYMTHATHHTTRMSAYM